MSSTPAPRAISNWLLLCCFMVFIMAVIGAVTRLTESGLSITEWKPVAGALPPLDEESWVREFDLYKQTPEYAAKHFWMELEDFKKIYFWEWIHRLWGRSIGIVFLLPLIWFSVRKQIPPGYGWKFLGLLALGGAQGFIGWFMVQSGLVDRPSVSHFRLALHLGMALLVLSLMFWMALDLRLGKCRKFGKQDLFGMLTLAFLATTILWGAFVAGLDAGMIYNTFPHMGQGFIPPDFGDPLHHAPGVQFTHRWLAITTLGLVLTYSWSRKESRTSLLLALMGLLQAGLGISTLLTQVNITLAALHQAGAIILLCLMLFQMHQAMRKQSQT